jgi:selenocysteine-specific elongation factor
VDHGKTALVRALTGVETDRWAEERERGLTIDLGFAPVDTGTDVDSGIVDVPGHEDFVKNMLAGSTGIDVLLLVIAADEGPMPQTREHLLVSRLLGIDSGLVILNKVDRVDDDWLDLVREATREEMERTLGHADWPVYAVSATSGEGIPELRQGLEEAAAGVRNREANDLFRMPVDRAFSVSGAGTVVTGTTWSGRVAVGDRVVLLPGGQGTRVRGLQVHGAHRQEVGPGSRCAVALVGVDAGDADRGNVLVGGDGWRTSSRLGAWAEIPGTVRRELEHGQRVRLFLGTEEVMARVRTLGRGPLLPGHSGWIALDCERPVVARVRDRFVLRFYSPVTTIGGGAVAALDPARGWREQVANWHEVLHGPAPVALAAAVRAAGGIGLADEDLPLATGLPSVIVDEASRAGGDIIRIGEVCYAAEQLRATRLAVLSYLTEAHERRRRATTEPLESVRAGLSVRFSPALIQAAIRELEDESEVEVVGPGIRRSDHSAGLTDDEERVIRDIVRTLAEAGLAPPTPAELSKAVGVGREVLNDLLRLLIERGELLQITPEIFLTAGVEEEARRVIREVAATSPASPGDFRKQLNLSRKYLIPLLEYMDRTGVTRRTPEGRLATRR